MNVEREAAGAAPKGVRSRVRKRRVGPAGGFGRRRPIAEVEPRRWPAGWRNRVRPLISSGLKAQTRDKREAFAIAAVPVMWFL